MVKLVSNSVPSPSFWGTPLKKGIYSIYTNDKDYVLGLNDEDI